jgi:hypothetical protein
MTAFGAVEPRASGPWCEKSIRNVRAQGGAHAAGARQLEIAFGTARASPGRDVEPAWLAEAARAALIAGVIVGGLFL